MQLPMKYFIKFNCFNLSQIEPNNLNTSQTATAIHNSALFVHFQTRHSRSLARHESLDCLLWLPISLLSPNLIDSDGAVAETDQKRRHAMTAPHTSRDVLLVQLFSQEQLQIEVIFLDRA
jgi:hypothetical protein